MVHVGGRFLLMGWCSRAMRSGAPSSPAVDLTPPRLPATLPLLPKPHPTSQHASDQTKGSAHRRVAVGQRVHC